MFIRTILCSLTLTLGLLSNATPASADDIQVGDEVLIKTAAPLWRGDQTFDSVDGLIYFKVERVNGKWLRGTFAKTSLNHMPTLEDVLNNRPKRKNPPPVTGWIDSQFVIATKGFKERVLSKRGDLKGLPANTKIVAMIGDSAPDGNGLFAFSELPLINDQQQVAFGATLLATDQRQEDDRGIFLSDGKSMVQIARKGQVIANYGKIAVLGSSNSGTVVTNFNDSGQIAFQATIGSNSRTNTIFRGDINGLSVITDAKSILPQVAGRASYFPPFLGVGQAANDQGEVVIRTDFDNSRMGGTWDVGIFVGDGKKTKPIIYERQPVPGSDLYFTLTGALLGSVTTLNNLGQVAISVSTVDTVGYTTDWKGIIIRSDGVELLKVAQRGQKTSRGEPFFTLSSPVLNSRGHIAFGAKYHTIPHGLVKPAELYGWGIYYSEGKNHFELKEVIRSGQKTPDGNGYFGGGVAFGVEQINRPSQILFVGTVIDAVFDPQHLKQRRKFREQLLKKAGNSPETLAMLLKTLDLPVSAGLFRSEPNSNKITTIARDGQISPDRDGFIYGIRNGTAMNEAGQVVFDAHLIATRGENLYDSAIFFYDDQQGLTIVARTEMPFLGSKVVQLGPLATGRGDDRSCLNAHGQIAFGFKLEDQREGIAVWTAPTARSPK